MNETQHHTQASASGDELTVRGMQAAVDEWIQTIGGRYFSELTNMALLTEETGELARVIARVYGDQIAKEGDLRKSLAEEMADVLWVLTCLANQTGVDLTRAFAESLEKKRKRDRHRFDSLRAGNTDTSTQPQDPETR